MQTNLFQAPRQFEALGYHDAGYAYPRTRRSRLADDEELVQENLRLRKLLRSRGRSGRGAFEGLGDGGDKTFASDVLDFIKFSSKDFVETLTGEKSSRETQERALALAKLQSAQAAAKSAGTAATVQAVIPWVVGGAVVIAGAFFLLKK